MLDEREKSFQREVTTKESAPRVSIVIVTWNTRELTAQCVANLKGTLEQLPAEIIVVDNNSTDGSADYLAAHHPDIILVRSEENLGFAR
ncbi:MAG TPA: glycosyltransferase, partial [Pyrinomonadaceae bacterium]